MSIYRFFEMGFRFFSRCICSACYRLKGLKIPTGCYVGTGIRFNFPEGITISGNNSLADGVRMWTELPGSADSRLTIDEGVQINREVLLDFTGKLHLCRNVLVSESAIIYTHSHGHNPRSVPNPTGLIIGENVWVGTRAVILPSVSYIGEGSVIGAGTIVSKNVPPGSIVVSQPQRMIKEAIQ